MKRTRWVLEVFSFDSIQEKYHFRHPEKTPGEETQLENILFVKKTIPYKKFNVWTGDAVFML